MTRTWRHVADQAESRTQNPAITTFRPRPAKKNFGALRLASLNTVLANTILLQSTLIVPQTVEPSTPGDLQHRLVRMLETGIGPSGTSTFTITKTHCNLHTCSTSLTSLVPALAFPYARNPRLRLHSPLLHPQCPAWRNRSST